MIFEIDHLTRFNYTSPVSLDPMTIRLRPRNDRSQRLLDFSMTIDPLPTGMTEVDDMDGNDTSVIWFLGETRNLEIRTCLKAETLRSNPFDYIVLDWQKLRLPMEYPQAYACGLERYRKFSGEGSVGALADEVARTAQSDGPVFLTKLAVRIAELIEGEVRLQGDPLAPAETLKRGMGSCRDAALLFMDACRAMGIAARFVSGYHEGDPEGERYLHAWAEVYLDQVGWRGYDPSSGLAVADAHLALAAGPDARSVAPTQGSLRGSALTEMDARIYLTTHPAPEPARR